MSGAGDNRNWRVRTPSSNGQLPKPPGTFFAAPRATFSGQKRVKAPSDTKTQSTRPLQVSTNPVLSSSSSSDDARPDNQTSNPLLSPPSAMQNTSTSNATTPSDSPRSASSCGGSPGSANMRKSESWARMARLFADEADASSDDSPPPEPLKEKGKPRNNKNKKPKGERGNGRQPRGQIRERQQGSPRNSPRDGLSPNLMAKKVGSFSSPKAQLRTGHPVGNFSPLPASPNSNVRPTRPKTSPAITTKSNNNAGGAKNNTNKQPPKPCVPQKKHSRNNSKNNNTHKKPVVAEDGWSLVPESPHSTTIAAPSDNAAVASDIIDSPLLAAFSDVDKSLEVLAPKSDRAHNNTAEQEERAQARAALRELQQAQQERRRKKKQQKQEQREQEMLEKVKRQREAALNAQESASGDKTSVHERSSSRRLQKQAANERYWQERRDAKLQKESEEGRRFYFLMGLFTITAFLVSVWYFDARRLSLGSLAVLLVMSCVSVLCAYNLIKCFSFFGLINAQRKTSS